MGRRAGILSVMMFSMVSICLARAALRFKALAARLTSLRVQFRVDVPACDAPEASPVPSGQVIYASGVWIVRCSVMAVMAED